MRIAILALQGAFAEHATAFRKLGADVFELRQASDLERPFDALVLPGGESTTQGKLLRELGMLATVRERILRGLPVFGTCAGAILLAERLSNDDSVWLGTLRATVRRNAYGRQLGSFAAVGRFADIENAPATFIRAPVFESVGAGVEVLSIHNGQITAVRQGFQVATTFHPELTSDLRIHQWFLDLAETAAGKGDKNAYGDR